MTGPLGGGGAAQTETGRELDSERDSRLFLIRQVRWAELTVALLIVLLARELAGISFAAGPLLQTFGLATLLQAGLAVATRGRAGRAAAPSAVAILLVDAATWLPVLVLTGGVTSPFLFLLLFPAAHAGLLIRPRLGSFGATLALVALFTLASALPWPHAAPPHDGRLVLGMALMIAALLLSVTFLVRTGRWTPPPDWVAMPELLDSLFQRTATQGDVTLSEDGELVDLLEDSVQSLAALPGVVFAAAVTGPGWSPPAGATGTTASPRCIALGSGQQWPQWLDLPPEAARLLEALELDAGRPFHAGDAATLRRSGFPPARDARFDSWILAPVVGKGRTALHVLVGLRAREADTACVKMSLMRLNSRLAPLLSASLHLGRLRGAVATLHAENETLTRINKMQSDFVAVASHELKTPLTSICAYTEALQRNWGRPEFAEAPEFLGIVRQEAERLLRMVNRILDFSRLEFGQRLLNKSVVDLEPLIRDTARTLEPLVDGKGLTLEIECPPLLPRVEIDADLIRQVLINLLNNAIKFTPRGGRLVVRACEDAATVRVTVSDTGPGIPATELRRIFRQFYRVSGASDGVEGVGLGLSIVKNIIDLHGGHIDVQSALGEGTSFIFHLPKEHLLNPVTAAILGDLTTRPEFQQLLRLTVRMVAEMTESKIVSLMLLDKDGRNLVVQAACGLNESIVRNAHVAIGKGIAGRVLQSGRPLLVKDVEKDGLLAASNRDQYETNSLVSVPLKIEEKVVGVINVNNKVGGAAFNEDDLALVTTLGDKVSAALTEAMKADSSVRRVDKIVDALQALIVMKRSAIPTATPLALRLLVLTARRLGLTAPEIRRLQYVASVHDVGMVSVDEEILLKAGPLDDDERDEVGQHPQQGVQLVEPLLQQPDMEKIILAHHERLDGTGYPRGLQGGEIPVGSRILAVIDAFFAMIQRRPYRDGRPAQEVVTELLAHAGTQFDAEVVAAFVDVLRAEGMVTAAGGGRAPAAADEAEKKCQPLGS